MGSAVSVIGSHQALRLALAGCLAALLAGCADSERVGDPFSNPFHTASTDTTPTGSLAAPRRPVVASPLAAPAPTPATYTPAPARPIPPVASAHSSGGVAGWTAEGGMPVVVAQGESAEIVARRYGIPEAALLRTNGFASASQVRPGTRLVIPVYNASLAASSGARVGNHHEVAEREPEHAAERPKIAKAVERKDMKEAKAEPRREEKPASKIERPTIAKVDQPPKIEKASLTQTGSALAVPKPAVESAPLAPAPHADSKTSADASAAPEFRWPAHGRVIHGFTGNDGIDIALPEGTPVKAAEAGVVAYAGSELKGYGNLVLIRHANGFVTAYANNGELDVKRGESVKRGQVIAKSGQTGNVTTPQLHFEVRKGAKPVDPVHYLANL
ncbi:MAG: peptidoglycan DD-metalloendopeptidase family protein [Methylovirgula sp.]